jgi:hypothetical protein
MGLVAPPYLSLRIAAKKKKRKSAAAMRSQLLEEGTGVSQKMQAARQFGLRSAVIYISFGGVYHRGGEGAFSFFFTVCRCHSLCNLLPLLSR